MALRSLRYGLPLMTKTHEEELEDLERSAQRRDFERWCYKMAEETDLPDAAAGNER